MSFIATGGISKWSQVLIDVDKAFPFISGTNLVLPSSSIPVPGSWDIYTKLVMHMDGLNGGVIFTDELGHVVTPVNHVVTDTATKYFGTASASFPSPPDYLTIPVSNDFKMGVADFTIDLLVYPTIFSDYRMIVDLTQWGGPGARNSSFCIFSNAAGKLQIFRSGGFSPATVNTLNLNAWNHIAFGNIGGVFKFFIRGTLDATTTNVPNITDGGVCIGIGCDNTNPFQGYMDELRISKGIARWTANFVPPIAPYAPTVALPDLTTDSLALISSILATLNGTVVNVNDVSITERGFVWDTRSHSNPGNVAPAAAGYANNFVEAGAFGVGAFSHNIAVVPFGTYFIRAFAKNSAGWNYGGEQYQEIGTSYGLSNLKELVLGMAHGDIVYHDGTKIQKLTPLATDMGKLLATKGAGLAPKWLWPDSLS